MHVVSLEHVHRAVGYTLSKVAGSRPTNDATAASKGALQPEALLYYPTFTRLRFTTKVPKQESTLQPQGYHFYHPYEHYEVVSKSSPTRLCQFTGR